jgi:cobalt-zinc-cadmium efflux system protein
VTKSHNHNHHHDDEHVHASHGHAGHHHGHQHGLPKDHGNAFTLAIMLNVGFVLVEFIYGFIADSTALLADAGHNLSDVLGLLLAWGAATLAKKQPTNRYTYGFRSTSILAAMANAMLLLVACGAIAWEAIRRFSEPSHVAGSIVVVVAIAGIVINGLSAWLFVAGSKDDLNIRGAFLHMAADAAVSFGVVIAGLIMLYTEWSWPDPAISLVIVAVVLGGTWSLLREAVQLSLSAVPANIELPAVAQFLGQLPGVADVNDLHIWGMSTTETALTVNLVMPQGCPSDSFIDDVARDLEQRFGIHHTTLQVKRNAAPGCMLTV